MAAGAVAQRASQHNASANSVAVSVSGLTAGNFLVCVVSLNGGTGGTTTFATPTDNGTGSAWQVDASQNPSAAKNGLQVSSTIIGSSPPTTITVSWTGTALASAVKIFEFSGIAAASWLDVAGTPAAQAAGTAASATTITPAVTGELIIGAFAMNAAQSTFTAGSGYTSFGTPTNTAGPDVCAEYKLSGTTSETNGGTYAASVTTTAQGVLVAYKITAAAAGVAPPLLVLDQAVARSSLR